MLRTAFILLLFLPFALQAQRTIKWKGLQLNALDKQGRKQGDWLFFDNDGKLLLNCQYHNDQVKGPRTFYNPAGDTTLLRFAPNDSLEHFIYYYKGKPLNGVFVFATDVFRIELDHLPEGFGKADLDELRRLYAQKISPVYMFGMERLRDYLSAAYYKSNIIPVGKHNFVITINASGKVTNVEWAEKEEMAGNSERDLFEMLYSMGRWQPFFDTWDTKEIKLTMSLGLDLLQPITSR